MSDNKSKSEAISAKQLPGHYYRPDGMPYGSNPATIKRRKLLLKDGIITEPVEVAKGDWALKEVGRQSTAESSTAAVNQQTEPTPEKPAEKVSGESAAVIPKVEQKESQPPEVAAKSGEDNEMAQKRAELGKLNEKIALEQDLAKAREKLATLKGEEGRESAIRREGDPGISRKSRKGLHRRNVLLFPKIPGMHCRVVNDTADGASVAAMIEDGWKIAQDTKGIKTESDGDVNRPSQPGAVVSRHVGVDASGKSIKGILMMIPQEIYEGRLREQQREIDELELSLSEPPPGLNRSTINVPGNPNLPAGLSVGEPESEADVRF